MSLMKIERRSALPQTLQLNTMYLTKAATAGYIQLTVVGDTLANTFRSMVPGDINALINTDSNIIAIRDSITALTAVVAEGLAARSLTRDLGTMAFVSMTYLRGSATRASLVSVGANSFVTQLVDMPGLEFLDIPMNAQLSISLPEGLEASCRVNAANQMKVVYRNTTAAAIDLAAHTVETTAIKRFPV